MKNTVFYNTLIEFLQSLYDAENQISVAMPQVIAQCSNEELKNGLNQHLDETREQIKRLQTVFDILGEAPTTKNCQAMSSIISEGKEVLQKSGLTPAVKDCFIIIGAQQIEHFEIANYGSLLALVKHMQAASPDKGQFKEIYDLLNETLKEEWNADKKLTRIAEGKMFTTGVNDEIESEITVAK